MIPLYNEEEGCKAFTETLVKAFDAEKIDYELILVDNGSVDKTADIIRGLQVDNPRVKMVSVAHNQGFGWGVINGLRIANGRMIGFMGGDEQVKARDVVKVYQKLAAGDYDFCKVKRIVRHDGLKRKVISGVYNLIFPLIFNVKSVDINGTPKIFKAEALEKVFPAAKDWFIDAELMIKSQRLGYRMGEVEIEFLPRQTGKSNVRLSTIWEFLRNLLYYRFRGFN